MLMDPEPAAGLPFYGLEPRCQCCGHLAAQRVPAQHPTRGKILVCGECAFVLGMPP
jgi:hypothetical protein